MRIAFEDWIRASLRPNMRGFDLGAGDGFHSLALAREYGVFLTAIDKKTPVEESTEKVVFLKQTVEDWVAKGGDPVDFIYCRRLIQQMDGEYVRTRFLPHLRERVKPGGVVIIETFYDHPSPRFSSQGVEYGFRSVYSTQDLCSAFRGWHILHAKEHPPDVDLSTSNTFHAWFHVTLIASCPA